MFNKDTVLLYLYQWILVDFLCKTYTKVDFRHAKILRCHFLDQYLLLLSMVVYESLIPTFGWHITVIKKLLPKVGITLL